MRKAVNQKCPICKHEFECMNIVELLPEAPLDVQLRHQMNDESLDDKRSFMVGAVKREYFYIPVEADNEEEAEKIAIAALDKFSEERFREEYHMEDEWEFSVDPLKKTGANVHRDFLIKKL